MSRKSTKRTKSHPASAGERKLRPEKRTSGKASLPPPSSKSSGARPGQQSERPADAFAVPTVVCFGEVLWDCLPRGLFLGGAPINAAYHVSRQGLRAIPVTSVGGDFLGEEARRRIAGWGVDTSFIGQDPIRPTGTVRAVLDASGSARYEIAAEVAWDRIDVTDVVTRLAGTPAALVYGTLALRDLPNRRSLERLLAEWPSAWRVVDLNFRAPFDTADITAHALQTAQVVKLNDQELGRLTRTRPNAAADLAGAARQFAETHKIGRVCVTAGARGAGLWWDGAWWWEEGRPVQVRDTVGAGDAFLGGLLGAWLGRGATPARALADACRVGEFVAAADGATPDYRLDANAQPVAG